MPEVIVAHCVLHGLQAGDVGSIPPEDDGPRGQLVAHPVDHGVVLRAPAAHVLPPLLNA